MSPTPKDPRDLRLEPSRHRDQGPGSQPDFSRVSSDSGSTARKVDTQSGNDFSRVTGSSDTTARRVGERVYTVEKGDSLSAIAKKFYGSANHWQEIFDANRDQLDDPDLIRPGQTLRIP